MLWSLPIFAALKVIENTENKVLLRPPRLQRLTLSKHFFFMAVDRSSEAPTDTKEVFFPQFRAWRLVNDKPLQSNQAINTEVKQVISFIWHFHELFYIF